MKNLIEIARDLWRAIGRETRIGANKNTRVDEAAQAILDAVQYATPEIGENGNWWIQGVDTNTSAQGSNGYSPYIGSNGHWYVYDDSRQQFVDTGVIAKADSSLLGVMSTNSSEGTDLFLQGSDGYVPTLRYRNAGQLLSVGGSETSVEIASSNVTVGSYGNSHVLLENSRLDLRGESVNMSGGYLLLDASNIGVQGADMSVNSSHFGLYSYTSEIRASNAYIRDVESVYASTPTKFLMLDSNEKLITVTVSDMKQFIKN